MDGALTRIIVGMDRWSRLFVALLVGTVVACGGAPVDTPSGAGAASSPSVAPSQSRAAATDARPPTATATGASTFPGVELRPLTGVQGDFVFAARLVYEPNGQGIGTYELWAIPAAAGGSARVVLRYPRDGVAEAWPTRYVSPDGRRYAFQIDRGDGTHRIVIADLKSGALTWLRTDDSKMHDGQPVWDPTGARIAFNRVEGNGMSFGVWVVNADGTGLKQAVSGANAPTYIYHWTPDGRWVAFSQNVGYHFVEVATGSRLAMDNVVSGDASWRNNSPRLIARGWESAAGGDLQYIFTTDAPAGQRTVLLRASTTSDSLGNPRWRPGTDEYLYGRYAGGIAQTLVRSLSGSERALPSQEMGSPAWSPDGSSIAYIGGVERTPSYGPGGAVVNVGFRSTQIRLVGADGTGDRLLYELTASDGPAGWCVCNDGLTIRHY